MRCFGGKSSSWSAATAALCGRHNTAQGPVTDNRFRCIIAAHVCKITCLCADRLLLFWSVQAELNVYEQFALQHCKGLLSPPAVCHEIEEAVLDIKHQLQLASKSSVSA